MDFPSFRQLNNNKPYVPLAGCVLEHVLYSTAFSTLAKLKYILGDSLAFKNHRQNKIQRTVDLSAADWACRLNCSKTEVFATQKELEEKGYFVITRNTNREGRNQKNVITPTLPNHIFQALSQAPTRWNTDITWHNDIPSFIFAAEYKRFYLDNTKLFIPLNFPLLKLIAANKALSSFAKILFINFLCSRHKYHITKEIDINQQNNFADNSTGQSFIISYKELATKFNCSTKTISKTIVELEKLGFIQKQQFFVSNDNKDDNRHDKSLWSITLDLPPSVMLELAKEPDRSEATENIKKDQHYTYDQQCYLASIETDSCSINTKNQPLETASERVISCTDPRISKIGQYNNKEYILNTKDLDNINSKKSFFVKKNSSSPKNLSELSISYKNSLEENKKEILIEQKQKINLHQNDVIYHLDNQNGAFAIVNSGELDSRSDVTNPIDNRHAIGDDVNTFSSIDYTNKIQKPLLEVDTYKETGSDLAREILESTKKIEEEERVEIIKETEKIPETIKKKQNKTLLLHKLHQLSEQSDTEEPINAAIGNNLVNTTTKIPVASTINFPSNSSSHNKSLSYNKSSTQAKSLKSFYPLSKKQVDKLNQLSSREFSNNFANQLLLKLYIRDPNKTFASTNHMIAYMSKAFRYEKHQAPMVNHDTFRFTANVSYPESVEMRQQEKYLGEVEYSIDTSYSSQLRKKIAGMFETKLAYQILTEGEFDYHATNDQEISQELEIKNDICQNLELSEENNITKFDHVLDHSTCYVDSSLSLNSKYDVAHIDYDNQLSINFTENDDINDKILTRGLSELPLKSSLPARQFTNITLANTCTVKLPKDLILTNHQQQNLEKAIVTVYGYVKIIYQQLPSTCKKLGVSRLPDEIFLTELDPNSIWYKIRKKLIDNFDEHIDKAWFSKLRAEEDVTTQKLTLIAPTNFLRDWINAKYSSVITDIAKKLDYQFVELITKK
jgi:DNA-binding MarR family transcriptional regulator